MVPNKETLSTELHESLQRLQNLLDEQQQITPPSPIGPALAGVRRAPIPPPPVWELYSLSGRLQDNNKATKRRHGENLRLRNNGDRLVLVEQWYYKDSEGNECWSDTKPEGYTDEDMLFRPVSPIASFGDVGKRVPQDGASQRPHLSMRPRRSDSEKEFGLWHPYRRI
jgi:hypothetical protein